MLSPFSPYSDPPLVFTDLDDTLFQTKRKCTDASRLCAASISALDRKGQPHSFGLPQQQALTSWLLNTTELIPVTGRNWEALSRVTLPFSSFKVASHGAVIITPEQFIDLQWKNHVIQHNRFYCESLLAFNQTVGSLLASPHRYDNTLPRIDITHKLHYEYHCPIYLVIKAINPAQSQALSDYASWLNHHIDLNNFYLHQNGNNVTWLPHGISKQHAVSFLLKNYYASQPDRLIIGIGDSLSDHAFLQLCDFMMMPQHSQIATHLSSLIHH